MQLRNTTFQKLFLKQSKSYSPCNSATLLEKNICPNLNLSKKAEKVVATAQHCFPKTFSDSKGNFTTGPHGLILNHWTKTSPMWTITCPGVDEKLLNFISIISSKIQVYYLKKCCELFFSYSNVKPHFL